MKRVSTLFLRMAVVLVGTPVIALCIFGLPWLANNPVNPNYADIIYPILIDIYISFIPFLVALYQVFKLLNYIDKNQAFTELSVKTLRNIKFCAITMSVLYVVIMPFVYLVAELDDAPGLIVIGIVPAFVSMVIVTFTDVLQKLFKNAIDIKL